MSKSYITERNKSDLNRKYPEVSKLFLEKTTDKSYSNDSLIAFTKQFGLHVSHNFTNTINPNFNGTFHYVIKINTVTKRKLKRDNDFRYYGISTREKAYEKLVYQTFKIIDCLLKNKTYTEIPKRGRTS